ncbi:MAG: GNAT family N-acetyltransferase [Deltaproteobacteria bacterium]|nr:GNAT family N-acetyltransferase [Deltaproteobacteria bacterium]
MIFRTPINTSRLLLKQESLHDFERFYSMSADPEVMQYIGDGSVYHWTKEVALDKYKDGFSRQNNHELGTLAVYSVDCDVYIGWCGVGYSKYLDHIELSYRYCRDSWGKGYATEAAAAILTQTYQVTDIDEILACTHHDNTASIRVLEKLGFYFSHSKLSKPIGKNIPVYKIDRKTYAAKGGTYIAK